jgi:hypothetical protein
MVLYAGVSPDGVATRVPEGPALIEPAPHSIPSKNNPINNFLSIFDSP